MAKTTTKTFQFENALEELEKLIQQMEGGKLSLEESLTQFEQGVKLIKQCQNALTQAEQKVQILIKKHGKEELTDFEER